MYNIKIKNPKIIRLEVPNIRFAPGAYRIYLSMADHIGGRYIDRIEYAAQINIELSDIFNTGRQFTISEGLFLPEGVLSLI
jgi:hypothetical protein